MHTGAEKEIFFLSINQIKTNEINIKISIWNPFIFVAKIQIFDLQTKIGQLPQCVMDKPVFRFALFFKILSNNFCTLNSGKYIFSLLLFFHGIKKGYFGTRTHQDHYYKIFHRIGICELEIPLVPTRNTIENCQVVDLLLLQTADT